MGPWAQTCPNQGRSVFVSFVYLRFHIRLFFPNGLGNDEKNFEDKLFLLYV
jgi:hypothetical protein